MNATRVNRTILPKQEGDDRVGSATNQNQNDTATASPSKVILASCV